MKVLIKNGNIIDGTGSPAFQADILVEDDKIIKIGSEINCEKCEIIDALNKVVSPGFIDMHSHGDLTILDVNKAEPSIMQGVTTINVAMCGLGLAPANEKVKEYYFNFVNKAFSASSELYDNLEQFFNAIEKKGVSINLSFFIPHGNVRAYVLGTKERKANESEMTIMKKIVRENMEAGAYGLSTGLVYPPGSVTPTSELIELSKIVSEYNGLYMSHMRNEGSGVIDEGMSELVSIAKEADVKAHISHWSVISKYAYKMTPDVIQYIQNARGKENLKITADITTYNDGCTSLSFFLLSQWVYENFNENLTNPQSRKKLINEIFEKIRAIFLADAPFYIKIIPKFILKKLIFKGMSKGVRIVSVDYNTDIEGMTLYDALQKLYPTQKIEEALLDLIKEEKGSILIQIKHKDEEKSVIPLFKQDFVCPSSDGFLVVDQNTHPRSYGAFPRVLERWVREMDVIPLEEAIRKMTSLPASILGLTDRGLIKEGYKADIVVYDPEIIKEKGTIKDGRQYPEGVDYVLVNGAITVKKGNHTGALNGKILKNKLKR
ncbi:MAG: amidohydrolase family protein [Candidatus Lokiarchaeota archaeon]|nr:amidohydrolase family protein [Candidatus Lokiarchaeota archaeon]MBD3340284.1 amidohydrolase family protein [Candidatus Lokiarchaeota archaeon]